VALRAEEAALRRELRRVGREDVPPAAAGAADG
jgi:hypothetical protein